ncbi:hypothetical protein ACIOD2_31485 [Amycolatopsis sp. NPDC088138]|uniref:hypothetical protein n=1 Tax=Amycolatopsis sp. NPDC088138 TaxID=3363938 RepID=UPI0037F81CF0
MEATPSILIPFAESAETQMRSMSRSVNWEGNGTGAQVAQRQRLNLAVAAAFEYRLVAVGGAEVLCEPRVLQSLDGLLGEVSLVTWPVFAVSGQ